MPEASPASPEVIHPTPESGSFETGETLPVNRHERGLESQGTATAPVQPVPVPSPAPAPLAPAATPLQQNVEGVLASGLADTYAQLDPATQQRFKAAGEETAGKISLLLLSSKVQVKKIVDLIVAWLRIIPGVNQFFLEQEAKIKADKILTLRPPQP
jgi:hypothetical protein